MKGVQLLNSIKLQDWIVIYSGAKQNAANLFITTYSEVIRSMGIVADRPKE